MFLPQCWREAPAPCPFPCWEGSFPSASSPGGAVVGDGIFFVSSFFLRGEAGGRAGHRAGIGMSQWGHLFPEAEQPDSGRGAARGLC